MKLSPTRFKWKSLLACVAAALLIVAAVCFSNRVFSFQNLLDTLELATYDLRIRLVDRQPGNDVAIILFDETSDLALMKETGGWPYPRYVYADLIDFLEAAKARTIGLDLMFIGRRGEEKASDERLIQSFVRNSNVVVAMNFDNSLERDRQFGLNITPDDVRRLDAFSLPLENHLDPTSINYLSDETGFFRNSGISFNTFRNLIPELMAVGDRVGFINQAPGEDGITRGSPLVLRFVDSVTGRSDYRYFPSLPFEVFLKTHFAGKEPPMMLSPDGHLRFTGYDVPLFENGNFLINWYNRNFLADAVNIRISQLETLKRQTEAEALPVAVRQQRLTAIEQELQRHYVNRDKSNMVSPYPVIAAWQVLSAKRRIAQGQGTPADYQLMSFFKDKIVFIGTTVAGSHDLKPTPMGVIAGVIVQATIFDNLHQNAGYIHKPSPLVEFAVLILLCVLVGLITLLPRKTTVEITGALVIIIGYTAAAVLLFKYQHLWLNLALPVVMMGFIAALVLITKYIRRTQEYQQAYALANTDSMTGLFNHRYFKAKLYECMTQSDIMGHPFSLILIDIDYFKKFNDAYGHQAGDEVLRSVARRLKESVRALDIVARYGGEEMAIVLQATDLDTALHVASKVVQAVASQTYSIPSGRKVPVTISAGVASYPQHGQSLEELVEFADQGLYRAKAGGRNQVGSLPDSLDESDGEITVEAV